MNFKQAGGTAALAAVLIIAGAGCPAPKQVQAPSAAPSAGQPAAQPPSAPLAAADYCDHPYFPLRNGHEIDYRSTGGGVTSDYSMKVTDATPTSAKLVWSFVAPKPFTMTQELGCAGGGIQTKTYVDMGQAVSGVEMNVETKNASGEVMPANPAPGSTWTEKYDSVTKMNLPGPVGARELTASTETVNKALGFEKVKVPAGEYDALKIEAVTTTTTEMPGVPYKVPPTVSTSYLWYVKGIGMVKQTTAMPDGQESVTEATKIVK